MLAPPGSVAVTNHESAGARWLSAEQVRLFKAASDAAARELSFETDAAVIRRLVRGALTASAA